MLKPLRYMETTVRFNVGPLLSLVTNDVASKVLGPLMTFGIIESELLASLNIVTGSPPLVLIQLPTFLEAIELRRSTCILNLPYFIIFKRLQYRYLDVSIIWVL